MQTVNNWDDIKFEKHPATDEGVRGTLKIAQYELSIVGGKNFYSTGYDGKSSSWLKPDQDRFYSSFEVAVIETNEDGSKEFTIKFFIGAEDTVLGWQGRDDILELISRIEKSLEVKTLNYMSYTDKPEITKEFLESIKDKKNLDRCENIYNSNNGQIEHDKTLYNLLIEGGFESKDINYIVSSETETFYIIDGNIKYTVYIDVPYSKLQIRYKTYVSNRYSDETPHLKTKLAHPRLKDLNRSYSRGVRYGNKIECWSITDTSRGYTAKGLLKKIKELADESENNMLIYSKRLLCYNKYTSQLKQKYPSAIIENISKYYDNLDKIKLTFPSGSYMYFNINAWREDDTQFEMLSYKDANEFKLDTWEEWADRFNKQK